MVSASRSHSGTTRGRPGVHGRPTEEQLGAWGPESAETEVAGVLGSHHVR